MNNGICSQEKLTLGSRHPISVSLDLMDSLHFVQKNAQVSDDISKDFIFFLLIFLRICLFLSRVSTPKYCYEDMIYNHLIIFFAFFVTFVSNEILLGSQVRTCKILALTFGKKDCIHLFSFCVLFLFWNKISVECKNKTFIHWRK